MLPFSLFDRNISELRVAEYKYPVSKVTRKGWGIKSVVGVLLMTPRVGSNPYDSTPDIELNCLPCHLSRRVILILQPRKRIQNTSFCPHLTRKIKYQHNKNSTKLKVSGQ